MARALFLSLMVVAIMCAPLRAEEHERPPRELPRILERANRGELMEPHHLTLIDRFARGYLFRAPGNVLEHSRFELAQLQLKKGRGEQAIETLQKLAAATKSEDIRSAALYDIGKVHEIALKDIESAAGVYAKVTGRFQAMARRSLITMYVRAGRADKAMAFLKAAAAKTTDKGEKLALLRRLADVARQAGKDDDAIAAYRQITEQFTEKDIEAIRAAAARRVREAFAKAAELRRQDRWREAEQLLHRLQGWAAQLAVAGRMDELQAVREEHHRSRERMEEMERRVHEEEEHRQDERDDGKKMDDAEELEPAD